MTPRAVLLMAVLGAVMMACSTQTDSPADGAHHKGKGSATSPPRAGQDLELTANPVLLLRFARAQRGVATRQVGSGRVRTSVSTIDGGHLRLGRTPGGGVALRFPRFGSAATYPRAVVNVEGVGSTDFASRARDLEWGADLRLDRTSSGSRVDDGDNVIQRGLSSDPAQFKAEVDHDRAACTVRGDQGTLIVRSQERLRPRMWYRLRCIRQRERLLVAVRELGADGAAPAVEREALGPMGSINFADQGIPVAIGGKLAHDGTVIRRATDQFNGELANPVIAYRS